MSKLIDCFKREFRSPTLGKWSDGWFIAKPATYWTFRLQWQRIKDACRVLVGKSQAYHYKADERTSNERYKNLP